MFPSVPSGRVGDRPGTWEVLHSYKAGTRKAEFWVLSVMGPHSRSLKRGVLGLSVSCARSLRGKSVAEANHLFISLSFDE